MRINSPYITGSATITGNLCVQGTIVGTITGVASTASYALNAETLDGLDSTQFVQTGSFNSYTSSASSSVGSLSSSIATTTSNLSSSVSSSIGSLSGSIASTTLNLSSSVSSSIGSLSGSIATTTSGLSSSIGSLSSSVATTTLNLSSSVSSSIGSLSGSVATTTSGLGNRIITIEGRYATTGSNTFVGSQVITGSLYITNDMVVQGCSCLQNITASAVSIGTNTVILNTATPAVRFAGISVQDSGSNAGVTGSIFWDGLCNKWVYSNPSGIGYSGGMLLSGPRTSTLGSEAPLTCNVIAKSGGGDHIYDSCIVDDGTTTCIKNNLIGIGTACFGDTATINGNLNVGNYYICPSITLTGVEVGGFRQGYLGWGNGNQTTAGLHINSPGTNVEVTTGYNEKMVFSTGAGLQIHTNNGGGVYTSRFLLDRSGNGCFSGSVSSTLFIGGVINAPTLCISNGIIGTNSNNLYLSSNSSTGEISFWGNQLNTRLMTINGCGNVGIGTSSPELITTYKTLQITGGGPSTGGIFTTATSDGSLKGRFLTSGGEISIGSVTNSPFIIFTNDNQRALITNTGITCFACQVCALSFYSNVTSGRSFGNDNYGTNFGWVSMYNNCGGIQLGMEGCTGGQLITGAYAYEGVLVSKYCGLAISANNGGNLHMRLDNSGNLGIGIAPKNGDGKLQMSLGTAITWGNSNSAGADYSWISDGSYNFSSGNALVINTEKARPVVIGTCGVARFCVGANGIITSTCQICAPTIKAGSSTTLTSGNITLSGYPTSICFGNGQTLNDNGGGGLTISSGAAIGLTAGSCIFMNCTTNFGKYQKSTNGNWYKIPFSVTKNNGAVATTTCIVNITDQPDGFNEYFIYIEYASRLQGVSDSLTQVSTRMYGVNRFSSGTIAVTDSYIMAGGSGCAINTHAPITAVAVGTCTVVVKVDFSASTSYSSFVWGEIRIYSIEPLNNYLTIPYNEW